MRKFVLIVTVLTFLAFISHEQLFAAPPPPNPVPTIINISPNSATVGSSGFTMTINGTNFISASMVRFNGQGGHKTIFISNTQLTVAINSSDLAVTGAFSITIFNHGPGGGTSNAQTFTVTPVPIGGGGTPTEVHFSGRAYPGATLTFIAKELRQEIPFAQDIAADPNGNFQADFAGILTGPQLWGIIVKDKEGRQTRPQYYNFDTQSSLLQAQNLFVPPTLGFTRPVITKGDFLTFIGYATPGSDVEFQIDGQTIKQKALAAGDGSYKFLFNTAGFDFGNHPASARQIDKNGQESDFSAQASFTVSCLLTPKTDLDDDGIIDIKDWSIFLAHWSSKDPKERAMIDFDNDGKIDISDFSIFIRTIKRYK